MFNTILSISYDDYDLKVGEIEGMLFITEIKTKRQRKFRSLKGYYREVNNIKINEVDRLLEAYGRNRPSIEERFAEETELIKNLGIDKEKVSELFKERLIEEIKNRVYQ